MRIRVSSTRISTGNVSDPVEIFNLTVTIFGVGACVVVGLTDGGATAGEEVEGDVGAVVDVWPAGTVVAVEPGVVDVGELGVDVVVDPGTVVVDVVADGAVVVLVEVGSEVVVLVVELVVDAAGAVVEVLVEEAAGTVLEEAGKEVEEDAGTVDVTSVVVGLGGGTIRIRIFGFGTTTVVDGVANVVDGCAATVDDVAGTDVEVVVEVVLVVVVAGVVVAGTVVPVGTVVVVVVVDVVVVVVVVVLVVVVVGAVVVDGGDVGVGAEGLDGVPSVTQTMTWEIDLSPLRPPGSEEPLRFVSAKTP